MLINWPFPLLSRASGGLSGESSHTPSLGLSSLHDAPRSVLTGVSRAGRGLNQSQILEPRGGDLCSQSLGLELVAVSPTARRRSGKIMSPCAQKERARVICPVVGCPFQDPFYPSFPFLAVPRGLRILVLIRDWTWSTAGKAPSPKEHNVKDI